MAFSCSHMAKVAASTCSLELQAMWVTYSLEDENTLRGSVASRDFGRTDVSCRWFQQYSHLESLLFSLNGILTSHFIIIYYCYSMALFHTWFVIHKGRQRHNHSCSKLVPQDYFRAYNFKYSFKSIWSFQMKVLGSRPDMDGNVLWGRNKKLPLFLRISN